MKIQVGYDIAFEFSTPTELLFALFLHPSRAGTVLETECLAIEPHVPYTTHIDAFGNLVGRAQAPEGRVRFVNYALVEDDGLPDPVNLQARQLPVNKLPAETLQFLLASRYCEVDSELSDLAWDLFGRTEPGWARVQAVCDFVHGHLTFDYQRARSTRTALQAYQEKTGVCRDYMHLAITLIRSLNIPARYATGYLGDIGVPAAPFPMDFSAWFQVYLEDRWYTFDARHNERRIGRVLMATGRDAADVALTTIFGRNRLVNFKVLTDELQVKPSKQTKATEGKKTKRELTTI
jgi:transglutaminase-like putative cysteine protease